MKTLNYNNLNNNKKFRESVKFHKAEAEEEQFSS